MEEVEETYIMIKPDGVQRDLYDLYIFFFVEEIISRFEKKGFKLTGLKLFQCPKELAEVRLSGTELGSLWFKEGEVYSWTPAQEHWLTE
ncbi:hypothetical protein RND71_017837 [Anisodus tanguticus]|uniref:nucleoside-diphosphate kinase n=1 Tax=Anisodus tanguticus TaxID=243964 RepID=A0AAE1S328_9SOLA|nr:hypothetical protein RND71_017837 [Anisodus tanguticus]